MRRRSFLKGLAAGLTALFAPIPIIAENRTKDIVGKSKILIYNDNVIVWAQKYCRNGMRWITRVIQKGSDGWVTVYVSDEKAVEAVNYFAQSRQQFREQADWFDKVGWDNQYYCQHAETTSTRYYWTKVKNGDGLTIYNKSSPYHKKRVRVLT